MELLVRTLKKKIQGEVSTDVQARRRASHDASIYELVPDIIVEPKGTADIEALVQIVLKNKASHPKLSITPRSAGTDVSGGAIGASIVLEMTPYMNRIGDFKQGVLEVQPGALFRDIDRLLDEKEYHLGFAPNSRAISTIGGAVANNAGGEQTLRYGNANRSVRELEVVLADGKPHTFKPLTKKQLDKKMAENTFEGTLYRDVYQLIENNYDSIKNARPRGDKNAMGYNLWDVWDRDTGIFDMTQLFTGSQGTLGILTNIKVEAAPKAPYSGVLLVYLRSTKHLNAIISTVMKHNPAFFEGFDGPSFNLGVRHFKALRKQLGTRAFLRQQAHLTKSLARFKGHVPNMLLTIGIDGSTQDEVIRTISALHESLRPFKARMDVEIGSMPNAAFWQKRRASLAITRARAHSRHSVPFIDDIAIPPHAIAQCIPEVRKIIRKYKLPVALQSHLGDGSLHIVPLIDTPHLYNHTTLEAAMRELIPLVVKHHGTLSSEHNDGLMRGPWLPAVFGHDMYAVFKQVKEIFDPLYIFNPHKKTDASWEFSTSHIREQNIPRQLSK